MPNEPRDPPGVLTIRTVAMPADTNPAGDIFGGWLLSQMDLGRGRHRHGSGQGTHGHRGGRRHGLPSGGVGRR